MLERPAVAQGEMGKVLADYLVEFLPFEEDHYKIIETIRFLLHTGLVTEETRNRLWKKGRNKNAYYVGFLEQTPDTLPYPLPSRHDWETLKDALDRLIQKENPFAQQMYKTLSGPGQTFLNACEDVLRQPATQDVVNVLLNALGTYFRALAPSLIPVSNPVIGSQICAAQELCTALGEGNNQYPALQELLTALPQLKAETCALLALSSVSSAMVQPIFARTTAIGTLMRTKMEPVTGPILQQIAVLRGTSR